MRLNCEKYNLLCDLSFWQLMRETFGSHKDSLYYNHDLCLSPSILRGKSTISAIDHRRYLLHLPLITMDQGSRSRENDRGERVLRGCPVDKDRNTRTPFRN